MNSKQINPAQASRGAATHSERQLVLESLPDGAMEVFLDLKAQNQDVDWLRSAMDMGLFRPDRIVTDLTGSIPGSIMPTWTNPLPMRPTRAHELEIPELASLCAFKLAARQRPPTIIEALGEEIQILGDTVITAKPEVLAFMRDLVTDFVGALERMKDHPSLAKPSDQYQFNLGFNANAAILLAAACTLDDAESAKRILEAAPHGAKTYLDPKMIGLHTSLDSGRALKAAPWLTAVQFGSTRCLEVLAERGIRADGPVGVFTEEFGASKEVGLGGLMNDGVISIRADVLKQVLQMMKQDDGTYSKDLPGWGGSANKGFVVGLTTDSYSRRDRFHLIQPLIEADAFLTGGSLADRVIESLRKGHMDLFRAYADTPDANIMGPHVGLSSLSAVIWSEALTFPAAREALSHHYDAMAVEVVEFYRDRGLIDSQGRHMDMPQHELERTAEDQDLPPTAYIRDFPLQRIVELNLNRTLMKLIESGLDPATQVRNDSGKPSLSLIDYAEASGHPKTAAILRARAAQMTIEAIMPDYAASNAGVGGVGGVGGSARHARSFGEQEFSPAHAGAATLFTEMGPRRQPAPGTRP